MNSGNANGVDSSAPYQWRAVAEHWGPTMLLVLIAAGVQVLLFFRNLTSPGWTALLWMGFGAQMVGAVLIGAAKMPVYRDGRYFTFGGKSVPPPLRGAYRWGWRCFTTGALVCMGLLLFLSCLTGCSSNTNNMKGDKAPEDDDAIQKFTAYMQELKSRTIYRELSPQILASIPDDKLEQAIRDFIALKIDNDWEHDVEKIPALGPGFSAVYFVSMVEAEVNNGGFNQLFWNSGREAVVHAKAGADLMGLSDLSGILGEALKIEEKERRKMAKFKQKGTMEALMDSYDHVSFEAVEDKFLAVSPKLEKAILSFIRKNPHMFEGKISP